MEGRAKELLYKTVGFYAAFNYSLREITDIFQTEYGFTENIWPADSIYKDCRRNLKIRKGDIKNLIAENIEKL